MWNNGNTNSNKKRARLEHLKQKCKKELKRGPCHKVIGFSLKGLPNLGQLRIKISKDSFKNHKSLKRMRVYEFMMITNRQYMEEKGGS